MDSMEENENDHIWRIVPMDESSFDIIVSILKR